MEIPDAVDVTVLRGIEVDVEGCHILCITDPSRAEKVALTPTKLGESHTGYSDDRDETLARQVVSWQRVELR